MAKEEYDKAIADYTEAIRLDPKDAQAYDNRGDAWYEQGGVRQGHRRLHRGHPARPQGRRGVSATGATPGTSKKEYDKAIADYTEAIRLDPKYARAYNNRGDAWYGKKEYDKAIADYTEAIRLDPEIAEAYNNRGNAWYAQGGVRQGHRRLHRGHPTRPQGRRGLQQPGHRLDAARRSTTRPSPTTPRPSGSIPSMPSPMRFEPGLMRVSGITRKAGPIDLRPCVYVKGRPAHPGNGCSKLNASNRMVGRYLYR